MRAKTPDITRLTQFPIPSWVFFLVCVYGGGRGEVAQGHGLDFSFPPSVDFPTQELPSNKWMTWATEPYRYHRPVWSCVLCFLRLFFKLTRFVSNDLQAA